MYQNDDRQRAKAIKQIAGGRYPLGVIDKIIGRNSQERGTHNQQDRASNYWREEAQHLAKDRRRKESK